MADPRWTQETEDHVTHHMWTSVPVQTDAEARYGARMMLNDLAEAGLLLAPGVTARSEYASEVLRDGEPVMPREELTPCSEELANDRVADHSRAKADEPGWRGSARKLTRTVHIEPWREAQ